MRDKRTPRDVCGEATGLACLQNVWMLSLNLKIFISCCLFQHIIYSLVVDLLTQFVGAMTELKNWSKSLLAEYGFWKKTMYVMDIALYQSG